MYHQHASYAMQDALMAVCTVVIGAIIGFVLLFDLNDEI